MSPDRSQRSGISQELGRQDAPGGTWLRLDAHTADQVDELYKRMGTEGACIVEPLSLRACPPHRHINSWNDSLKSTGYNFLGQRIPFSGRRVIPMSTLNLNDTGDWPAYGAASKTAERAAFSTLVRVDLGGLSHPGLVRPTMRTTFSSRASGVISSASTAIFLKPRSPLVQARQDMP